MHGRPYTLTLTQRGEARGLPRFAGEGIRFDGVMGPGAASDSAIAQGGWMGDLCLYGCCGSPDTAVAEARSDVPSGVVCASLHRRINPMAGRHGCGASWCGCPAAWRRRRRGVFLSAASKTVAQAV